MYCKKGKKQKEIIEVNKPDSIQKINEKNRIEKENEIKMFEKQKKGIWDCHAKSREWYWTGEGEPDYGDQYF